MILVIGGYAAGKCSYVRSLGFADADMSKELNSKHPVMLDVQNAARALNDSEEIPSFADRIASMKQIAVCVEVGGGIVPIDAEERAWRDRAGKLTRELSARADVVVRVVCGIPQVLKGSLPAVCGSANSEIQPDKALQIVIMRHGATEANEKRVYAGSTDVALTASGEAQAQLAGVCPHVATVYVSPLQRARRTAEICFPNATQLVIDDLREMDFGEFEGRSAKEMEHDTEYRAWVEGMCEGRCPNGEKRDELTQRVSAAVDRIVRDALDRGEHRVVVVGHGGTIMAAMSAFSKEQRDYFAWRAGNCEGFRARAVMLDGRLQFDQVKHFTTLGFLETETRQDCKLLPSSTFFQNVACEYFPCHEGIDERDFNCLFCYCPLYALGSACGGNFTYTARGRKNCTKCTLPHQRDTGTSLVASRYAALAELAKA